MRKFYLALVFALGWHWLAAQPPSSLYKIKLFSDSVFQIGTDSTEFPGVAAAFVSKNEIAFSNFGSRVWGKDLPTDSATLFHLGSVGKMLTAIAVLQQVERGNLSLDANVNTYLKNFSIQNPYDETPVTLRCLLTHSCGFNDSNIGYLAKTNDGLEPLGVHLQQHMPTLFQPPGQEINYSNYSYALAGYLVERASNTEFTEYIGDNIFKPLGMENSAYRFPDDYSGDPRYAPGYKVFAGDFVESKVYPRHAIPAGSLVSSSSDMAKLLQAILRRDITLLTMQSSWESLFTRQFSNHPLLPGYSLGLEEQNINGVTTWAKGGMLTGFLSHVHFINDSLAMFVTINTGYDNFLELYQKGLMDKLFPSAVVASQPIRQVDSKIYAGEYTSERQNHGNVESIAALFQGAFYLNQDGAGNLKCWHNGGMHRYIPVAPDIFQNDSLAYEYLVFTRSADDQITGMYRQQNIGGLSIPVSYRKQSWYNSPTFVNDHYGFVIIAIFQYTIPLLFALAVWLFSRYGRHFKGWRLLPFRYTVTAALVLLVIVLQFAGGFMNLFLNMQNFLFGYPTSYLVFNGIGYLIPLLFVVLLFQNIKIWKNAYGIALSRVLHSLMTVGVGIHAWFLTYWHFIDL